MKEFVKTENTAAARDRALLAAHRHAAKRFGVFVPHNANFPAFVAKFPRLGLTDPTAPAYRLAPNGALVRLDGKRARRTADAREARRAAFPHDAIARAAHRTRAAKAADRRARA